MRRQVQLFFIQKPTDYLTDRDRFFHLKTVPAKEIKFLYVKIQQKDAQIKFILEFYLIISQFHYFNFGSIFVTHKKLFNLHSILVVTYQLICFVLVQKNLTFPSLHIDESGRML